jgi:hypothetical protein
MMSLKVYEESLGFRGCSAKAGRKSDCSPLAKAQWQYGKPGQYWEAVAIWKTGTICEALVINGLTDSAIKC